MVAMAPTGKSLPVCKLLSRAIFRTLASYWSLGKRGVMKPTEKLKEPDLQIRATTKEKKVSKVTLDKKRKTNATKSD